MTTISVGTKISHWALVGQSNVLLRCAVTDSGGAEFNSLYPGSTWWRDLRLSGGATDSIHADFGSMSPTSAGKFGIERPLRERFCAHFTSVAEGATKLSRDWLPTTQYMYVRARAQLDASLARLGRSALDGVVWWQGTNDANDSSAANAYQTNLGTLFTDLRSHYGAFKLVIVYMHVNDPSTFAATVRTKQEAYVAADADSVGINPDAYTNDGTHYPTASYVSIARDIHSAIVTRGWSQLVAA